MVLRQLGRVLVSLVLRFAGFLFVSERCSLSLTGEAVDSVNVEPTAELVEEQRRLANVPRWRNFYGGGVNDSYKNAGVGHYESHFVRANSLTSGEGVWLRYTVFHRRGAPADECEGELWAAYFNSESHCHTACKIEVPLSKCKFSLSNQPLLIQIDNARMNQNHCSGSISSGSIGSATGKNSIEWNLQYRSQGGSAVKYFLPLSMYDSPLPKAKSVIPTPIAVFNGSLIVNGKEININNWVGSANHNWGVKHTDSYAWCQVCQFDGEEEERAPSSFEAITGSLYVGIGIWSPAFTMAVLRHRGREYKFNQISAAFSQSESDYRFFEWRVKTTADDGTILTAHVTANKHDFVGLTYRNPPGGSHTCLNSKIASCRVTVTTSDGEINLISSRRAAFEILTDESNHGVQLWC